MGLVSFWGLGLFVGFEYWWFRTFWGVRVLGVCMLGLGFCRLGVFADLNFGVSSFRVLGSQRSMGFPKTGVPYSGPDYKGSYHLGSILRVSYFRTP